MQGRTHLASGILIASIFLAYATLTWSTIIYSLLFLLGTIFPDIDHTKSIVGKKIKLIGWAFIHRGFFHSIFGLILISLIPYYIYPLAGIFFAMGYATHLLEDMLTKSGIKLFIFGPRISGCLVVGEFSEKLVLLILRVMFVIFIIFFIFKKFI